ncbi:hypothetical protein PR001_g11262 [Phytophthora rubi]|uniref:RING-type domain-containing protein n=1 Tax=Phytophthora rubi TaxID=129364 RepID=A0A6A3ML89_9STRA|nr:hypothetical protein PR001_g11262 [Phytophthora rubi]
MDLVLPFKWQIAHFPIYLTSYKQTFGAMTINPELSPLPRRTPGASKRHIRWFTIDNLRYHVQRELPLLVSISSTSTTADPVVYNCAVSSVASKRSWTVSYRYSEFVDFRAKLEDEWTCHNTNCSGSCQALRDVVSAYFPKKRLAIMSSSHGAITSRKHKLELVLTHLLRSVLLPGSVMKCMHARENLPTNVLKFLGVTDPSDRRSLLQIFVDHQEPSASMTEFAPLATQCMICLGGDHQHRGSASGDTEDSNADSPVVAADATDTDHSHIMLPCHHTFHRKCIFQWLLFEFHCPVCRTGIFLTAITNHCRPAHHEQWWLSDFEEELSPATSD